MLRHAFTIRLLLLFIFCSNGVHHHSPRLRLHNSHGDNLQPRTHPHLPSLPPHQPQRTNPLPAQLRPRSAGPHAAARSRRRSPAPHRRRRPGPHSQLHSQPQRPPPPPPRGPRRCHRSDRGRRPPQARSAARQPEPRGAARKEAAGGPRGPNPPCGAGKRAGGKKARRGGRRRGPGGLGTERPGSGAGRRPLPARGGSRSPRALRRSCRARPELLLPAAALTCPRRPTRSRSAPCAASGRLRKMAALPGETTPGARRGEARAGCFPQPWDGPSVLRAATAALPRALPGGAPNHPPSRPRWGWRRLWALGRRGCFSTRRCCTRRCGRSCPPPAGPGSTASTAPCC